VLSVLALPLLPIAVSYLILVPLMSVARFLRNKNAVMTLGAIVGLVFAMAFNFTVQSAASHMTDPAWILANYAGPGAFLAQAGHVYPPALLAWKATGSAGLGGLGYLVANLGSGLLALLCCAFLLGPAYAASLSRFGEMQLKRLKKGTAGSFIGKTILRRPIGLSLLQRELKLMNREPIYFINGPLIVLLLPVILGVALVAQGNQLSGMIEALRKLGDGPWLMLIAAAFGAFLGSSTSITCTAISRDAKAFAYLKALPIPMRSYALAKFLHGFVFALFGALVGSLGLGLLIGLTPALALGALFIGLSLSSLVGIAGLWLDTVNPRLAWDNPIAAMKQNPNSLIVILGAMAVLGLLGALAPILDFGVTGFLVAYGLLPALLVVAALLAYPRFAERRLARLEI
jgi:ABC-2 type transport system permease protein